MNDSRRLNYHKVAIFGSWEWDYNDDDIPYTQCFEAARQAGMFRFATYPQDSGGDRDRDFDDLYRNDVVSPAVIVVPHCRRKRGLEGTNVKRNENEEKWEYSYDDIKEVPSFVVSPPRLSKSKPVDEDLYKIPSDSLPTKPKKKRPIGTMFIKLFAVCMRLISRI